MPRRGSKEAKEISGIGGNIISDAFKGQLAPGALDAFSGLTGETGNPLLLPNIPSFFGVDPVIPGSKQLAGDIGSVLQQGGQFQGQDLDLSDQFVSGLAPPPATQGQATARAVNAAAIGTAAILPIGVGAATVASGTPALTIELGTAGRGPRQFAPKVRPGSNVSGFEQFNAIDDQFQAARAARQSKKTLDDVFSARQQLDEQIAAGTAPEPSNIRPRDIDTGTIATERARAAHNKRIQTRGAIVDAIVEDASSEAAAQRRFDVSEARRELANPAPTLGQPAETLDDLLRQEDQIMNDVINAEADLVFNPAAQDRLDALEPVLEGLRQRVNTMKAAEYARKNPTASGLLDDAVKAAEDNGDIVGAQALSQEVDRARGGGSIMNEIHNAPSVNQADDAAFTITRDQKLNAAKEMFRDANQPGVGTHRAAQLRTIAEGLVEETYQASRIRKAQSFANTNIAAGAEPGSIAAQKLEQLLIESSAGEIGQTKGSGGTLGAFRHETLAAIPDPDLGLVTEITPRKTVINASRFENPVHLEAVLTHENAHQRILQLENAAAAGDQTARAILRNLEVAVGEQPWRAGDIMDDAIRSGIKSKAYKHVPPHGDSHLGQVNEQMADLFVLRAMDPEAVSPQTAHMMEGFWGKLNVQSRVPTERLDLLVPNPNIGVK